MDFLVLMMIRLFGLLFFRFIGMILSELAISIPSLFVYCFSTRTPSTLDTINYNYTRTYTTLKTFSYTLFIIQIIN